MNKERFVPVLVLLILAVMFFLQFKHNRSMKITTGRRIGTFTTTEAVLTGDRNTTMFVPLSQFEVDGVEKFVMFTGYSRSGHSIIGAMMDAHPNIVIANEYNVLERCVLQQPKLKSKAAIFNGLYKNSYTQSIQGWRSEKNTKKGYNLHINTPWQGTFSQLRVIGDKKGESISRSFSTNPTQTEKCFNLLKETIKIPIVMFHVVRNPFDIIATKLAHRQNSKNTREMVESGKKLRLRKQQILNEAAFVFRMAKAALELMESSVMSDVVVVEIHSENFIKHPQEHINIICEALGIPCPVEYVRACHEKVFTNISNSRQIIDWDNDVVEGILTRMKEFPFLSSYTFDS